MPASGTHAPLMHLAARLWNSGGFSEVCVWGGGTPAVTDVGAGVRLAPSHACHVDWTRCAELSDADAEMCRRVLFMQQTL